MVRNTKLYFHVVYYLYFIVLQIAVQDHHRRVAEVVPDQALLLALLPPVQQVLLEVLEIEEENEAEVKV